MVCSQLRAPVCANCCEKPMFLKYALREHDIFLKRAFAEKAS